MEIEFQGKKGAAQPKPFISTKAKPPKAKVYFSTGSKGKYDT
jgi:hypothetical protein